MLIKNTSTSNVTWLEINGQTSMTVYPGEIVQCDDQYWRTAINENSNLSKVTYWSETKQTVVTMTTAEILALYTTPKTLVIAPWAWKAIIVDKIIATMDYWTAAYATYTTIEFRYTNASWTKVTANMAAILDQTADTYVSVWGIEAELAITSNAAIIAIPTTWNPITWDSDIIVTTIYREVSL